MPVPQNQGGTGILPVANRQSGTGKMPVPQNQGGTGILPVAAIMNRQDARSTIKQFLVLACCEQMAQHLPR
jgi:hypothetical protein